jgi:hypothetical protein
MLAARFCAIGLTIHSAIESAVQPPVAHSASRADSLAAASAHLALVTRTWAA